MDISCEEGATKLIPIWRCCRCFERLPGGDRLRKRVQEDEHGIDVADGVPCPSTDLPGPVGKTLERGIELLDLGNETALDHCRESRGIARLHQLPCKLNRAHFRQYQA